MIQLICSTGVTCLAFAGSTGPVIVAALNRSEPRSRCVSRRGARPLAQDRFKHIPRKAQPMKPTVMTTVLVAAGLVFAAPAQADLDTDFANELHTYGIYGQKDYNAWIGKIACKRLHNGVDTDATNSAQFLSMQLQKGHQNTEQVYQFLGAALRTYCPESVPILLSAEQ